MPFKPFSLKEAASFLHLSVSDTRALAVAGEIPCERRNDEIIFRRRELKTWASQRILGLRGKHLQAYHSEGVLHEHDLSEHATIVTDLCSSDYMVADLVVKTKPAVLKAMVEVAEGTGLLYDPDDLLEELKERERICSTGIENGAAILHPRHHDPYMVEDSFLCIARVSQGIFFGAVDGSKTDIFFLLCCQDDNIHLHTLARISLLCHSGGLLEALREAEDEEEMFAALVACEKAMMKKV